MDKQIFNNLYSYVRGGGQLVLLLPHLTASTEIKNITRRINPEWPKKLCGVKLDDGDVAVNTLSLQNDTKRFPTLKKMLSKQLKTQIYKRPNLGCLAKKIISLEDSAKLLITETHSEAPFLIENRVGQGKVFLFNLAEFPRFPLIYGLINAALSDIISTLPIDIYLKKGQFVNFYVYDKKDHHNIYLIRNDWFMNQKSRQIILSVFGKDIKISVAKKTVSLIRICAKTTAVKFTGKVSP